MTADPPGRAPNPSWWAVQRPDGWRIAIAEHDDDRYSEYLVPGALTADAALAWLTDHRRRNPR